MNYRLYYVKIRLLDMFLFLFSIVNTRFFQNHAPYVL